MNRYLIRWENNAVYSITAYPQSGIMYIAGEFLASKNLEDAKIGLEARDIDCTLIEEELSNPKIRFDTNLVE